MGTTAHGLPYPEPTAPVANGAADMRALAEAIDPHYGVKVAAGVASVTTDAFGNVVLGAPYVPAGCKVIAGVVIGNQRDYPAWGVLNSQDIPLGGAAIAFKMMNGGTTTAIANLTISVGYLVVYSTV